MINRNALYGYYGPDTFWCHWNFKLKDTVTKSPVVNHGGPHEFHLSQRFMCCTKNVVYLLHCQICKDAPSHPNVARYTCHVGFSENPNGRLQKHFDPNASIKYKTSQKLTKAAIEGYIRNGENPGRFRQDMFTGDMSILSSQTVNPQHASPSFNKLTRGMIPRIHFRVEL